MKAKQLNRFQRYRQMCTKEAANGALLPATVLATGAKRPRSSYQTKIAKVRKSSKKVKDIVSGSQLHIKSYLDLLRERTEQLQTINKDLESKCNPRATKCH